MHDVPTLIEQIQALPPDKIAEVEDFVAFIAAREHERALTREMMSASAPVLARIWDNPEDACYDAI